MKVLQSIPGIIKVLMSLPELRPLRKEIDAARAAGDDKREQDAILKATIMWGNHLVRTFKADVRVEGRENIPTEGPVVYVCNHQSFADIPILCSVLDKVQFGFIAKKALDKLPLYGEWMKRIRSVMIERDDARASLRAISTGVEYIKRGFSMAIFPEGTRARTGPMNEFKQGALKLATKPGVPLIPISLNGSYQILEEADCFRFGKRVDLIIHPSIQTAGLDRKAEKALNDEVYHIIRAGVEDLKARKAAGYPDE